MNLDQSSVSSRSWFSAFLIKSGVRD